MHAAITCHLLEDGVIRFIYDVDKDNNVTITDISYAEDFTLEDTDWDRRYLGEICYRIDPLDYVVNPELAG